MSSTFTDQASSGRPIKSLQLSLQVPYGWDVRPVAAADTVQPGQQVEATWQVKPPSTFSGGATPVRGRAVDADRSSRYPALGA